MTPAEKMATVPFGASAADVERADLATGRSRFPAIAPDREAIGEPAAGAAIGAVVGVAHVRDALRATTAGNPARAGELVIDACMLPAGARALSAVRPMRESRAGWPSPPKGARRPR